MIDELINQSLQVADSSFDKILATVCDLLQQPKNTSNLSSSVFDEEGYCSCNYCYSVVMVKYWVKVLRDTEKQLSIIGFLREDRGDLKRLLPGIQYKIHFWEDRKRNSYSLEMRNKNSRYRDLHESLGNLYWKETTMIDTFKIPIITRRSNSGDLKSLVADLSTYG